MREIKGALVAALLATLLFASCDLIAGLGLNPGGLNDGKETIPGVPTVSVQAGANDVNFIFTTDGFGIKSDGTHLTAETIIAKLYYSQSESSRDGLMSSETSISSEIEDSRIDGNSAQISGLTPGKMYYYLVVLTHPEDETLSVESEVGSFTTSLSRAPGAPSLLSAVPTQTAVTITFTAPVDMGVKSDGETPVPTEEVLFEVYYTKEIIRSLYDFVFNTDSAWSSTTSNQTLVAGTNTIEITGLTPETTYFYVVTLKNPDNSYSFSVSDFLSFTTTKDETSPGDHPIKPSIPVVTTQTSSDYAILNITSEGLGTKSDGSAVGQSEIKVAIYYTIDTGTQLTSQQLKELGILLSSEDEQDNIGFGDGRPNFIYGLEPGSRFYFLVLLIHPEDSSLVAESPVGVFTTSNASGPGSATNFSTTVGDTTATIMFTAPTDFGLKSDGLTPVKAGEVPFILYYSDSVEYTNDLTDEQLIAKIIIGAKQWSNSSTNQVMVSGENRINLAGLSERTTYYYYLTIGNPDNLDLFTDSKPGMFTTTGELVLEHPSPPKLPDVVVQPSSNHAELYITPKGLGTKSDGTAIQDSEIKLKIYYAKAGTDGEALTAEQLKQSGALLSSENSDDFIGVGGDIPNYIPELTPASTYYYVIVLTHPDDATLMVETPVGQFTTTESNAPGQPTGFSATTTDTTATIEFTAPTDLGKKRDGSAFLPGEIPILVNYADTPLGFLDGNFNSWNSVIQQQAMVSGVNSIRLSGLKANTEYYYFMLLMNPEANEHSTQTEVMSFTTKEGSTSTDTDPSAPGQPTVSVEPATNMARVYITPNGLGTKSDGSAVGEFEIGINIYYAMASSDGVALTAEQLKQSGSLLSSDSIESVVGVGTEFPNTISNLTMGSMYYYLVVLIHPNNSSLVGESAVGSFTTLSATPPGLPTSISATATTSTATVTFTAPDNLGMQGDGTTAVPVGEVIFALYYSSELTYSESADQDALIQELFSTGEEWQSDSVNQLMTTGENSITLSGLTTNMVYSYLLVLGNPYDHTQFTTSSIKQFTTQ